MGCVCCGDTLTLGALCRRCALDVAPCEGLIPDHIRSTVDAAAAAAWVVDGFGTPHAIGPRAGIGRHPDRQLAVLASSVSRQHAELAYGGVGWTLRDLGSRNGTFVNGAPVSGEIVLPLRARIKLGSVALWFLSRLADEPPPRPINVTGGETGGLVRYRLNHPALELCIVAGGAAADGGALLWRRPGSDEWSERNLAPLEFQLLRALCARAAAEAASPSPIRGCVATKQLARELPFLSRYANQDNVRQIAMRLRGVLTGLGATGLLAVAPGRGYYVTCNVIASRPARRPSVR